MSQRQALGPLPVIGALFSGPVVGRDLLVAGVTGRMQESSHGALG